MSEPFDPYAQWLGIQPHEMPVDHYRLLGVTRFEQDPQVIAATADERMAHVRSFQTGPRGSHTQALLNELAAARVCLLNPPAKASYDQMLEGMLQASAPPSGAEIPAAATPVVVGPPSHQTASRPWLLGALTGLAVAALGAGAVVAVRNVQLDTSSQVGQKLSTTTNLNLDVVDTSAEEPEDDPVLVYQEGDGRVNFDAAFAQLHGPTIVLGQMSNVDVMTRWESMDDWVSWSFKVIKVPPQGVFRVQVTYAARPESDGGSFVLAVGEHEKECEIRGTGEPVTDEYFIAVPSTGEHTLTVRPKRKPAERLMTLKSVTFGFPE